jgi:hypothetical protein
MTSGSNGPLAQKAVPCHGAIAHLTSVGASGGHTGLAGLSVHSSVATRSRPIEVAPKIGAA